MRPPRALVIGASALDIKGQSNTQLIPHTKNPGTVEATAGGVGRNIAENLARLGIPTTLLTALGEDLYARHIREVTSSAGVDMDRALVLPQLPTGTFLALMNHHGDLESAVAAMEILGHLGPDYLARQGAAFEEATLLVVDADIPEESLRYCLDRSEALGIPICVEPISVAFSRTLIPHLERLSMVTPNRAEAEVLVGFPLRTAEDIRRAGATLIERGVRWVVITLGSEGVLAATRDRVEFLPSISTVITDTVGAGDALTAGTVCGLMEGMGFFEAIRQGIACATLTLETRLAVHPELTRQRIQGFLPSRQGDPVP